MITIMIICYTSAMVCFSFSEAKSEEIVSDKIRPLSIKSSEENSKVFEDKTITLLNKIFEEHTKNKLTFSWWWGIISGLSSMGGFIAAFYFYWKSKRTDEVVLGFFEAISAESNSVLIELEKIKAIGNPDYFNTMKAKVETAHSFMASLNHTIYVFKNTLWPSKMDKAS